MDYKQMLESAAKELALAPPAQEIPLALMTTPPVNPIQRALIGDQMWAGVVMRFIGSLTECDRVLWQNPPADRIEQSPEHLRLMHAFDDFLLGLSQNLGGGC